MHPASLLIFINTSLDQAQRQKGSKQLWLKTEGAGMKPGRKKAQEAQER
jgi:hypothetical protein